MLEGTKKLFPSDYQQFKSAMLSAADDDNLPVQLQLNDIANFTLKDFEDLFTEFNFETSLEMRGKFSISPDCGKLRLVLEVDRGENREPRFLQ